MRRFHRSFVCAFGLVALVLTARMFAVVPIDGGGLITTNYAINLDAGVDAFDPHVSGDLVSYTADANLRYYDFVLGSDSQVPAPPGATEDVLSDVDGGRIVFTRFHSGSARILVYDTSNNSTFEVDPQPRPLLRWQSAIRANTVAFFDQTLQGGGELFASFLGGTTSQITNDGRLLQNPNVGPAGNLIVWESCAAVPTDCDIRQATWNGSSWIVTLLTNNSIPEANPDTDGVVVVYDAQRSDVRDICWQPAGGGGEQCLDLPGEQRNPAINDGLISFESMAVGESTADLFVHHIATNRLFRVTSTAGVDETLNDVSALGNARFHLVWAEGESDHRDVRGVEFTLPPVSIFSFSGFQQPVDPYPSFNVMKAGAAVPVRFSLGGFRGLNIFEPGFPKSAPVTCGSSTLETPVDETVTAGNSSISYSATSDQYSYVWKTDKSWANACRQLSIRFTDGSTAYANFKFK